MQLSNLLEELLNEKYRPYRRETDLDDFVESIRQKIKERSGKSVKPIIHSIKDDPNLQNVRIEYEV